MRLYRLFLILILVLVTMLFLTSFTNNAWAINDVGLLSGQQPISLPPLARNSSQNTYAVTTTNDSGVGSLRWAITQANATAGLDAVTFSITVSENIASIQLLSSLPTISDSVQILGNTQPGYTGSPLIELDGTLAGISATGLHITAGNSQINGLVINRFAGDGIRLAVKGSNVITGTFIGTDSSGLLDRGNAGNGIIIEGTTGNIIGGTTPESRNLVSGNQSHGIYLINGASTNQIAGNYVGTNMSGTLAIPNMLEGIFLNASHNNTVGGTDQGAGNLVSGNGRHGIRLGGGASNNLVQGNYAGTQADGLLPLPNVYDGIRLEAGSNNLVGGTLPAARNLISGNGRYGISLVEGPINSSIKGNYIGTDKNGTGALGNLHFGIGVAAGNNNLIGSGEPGGRNIISANYGGIMISETATSTWIQGNFIGTTVTGTLPLSNTQQGIYLYSGSNATVGGTAEGANIIAYNGAVGIEVGNSSNNRFSHNAIFDNRGLGIDLSGDGLTPNDDGDVDIGPNLLQNYPVLTAATPQHLVGHLRAHSNISYTLEFFANPTCDDSEYGEGETFVGETTIQTNSGGNATFIYEITPTLPIGQFLTATATDPSGNTSEFSRCLRNPRYDWNGNDQMEVGDIQSVARLWENPGVYNPLYDVVPDGVIDAKDIMEIIQQWNTPR
jgi:parallel beta-helix repeat protein